MEKQAKSRPGHGGARGRGKTRFRNGLRSFPGATKPPKGMKRSEARGKSHAGNGSFQNRADARIGSATGERRASGRAADTHRKGHAVASKTRHGMASCGKKSDGGTRSHPSTSCYAENTAPVHRRQEIFRRKVVSDRVLRVAGCDGFGGLHRSPMPNITFDSLGPADRRSIYGAVGSVAGQVVGEALFERRHVVEEFNRRLRLSRRDVGKRLDGAESLGDGRVGREPS